MLILLSYELPILLVIAAIAVMSGSYNLAGIVGAQSTGYYFALLMPIGFLVFFIAMLAEFERPPFDLKEADSELIAGWLTDYSSPYYALALFLDYCKDVPRQRDNGNTVLRGMARAVDPSAVHMADSKGVHNIASS